MKTALNIIQDLRKLLLPIEAQLSGGKIRQYNRLLNSVTNDIVLNILGADNEFMQFAIANINIHTVNTSLELPNNGGKDNTQPNLAAFDNLVSLVMPIVEEHIGETFRIKIRKDVGLIRDSDGSWYYNIQVNYWSIQNKSTA